MIQELNNDVAKEIITVLSYCENSIIKNIPKEFIVELNLLAADSTLDIYIDKSKSLLEQDISNECKNMLGSIYYTFVLDSKGQESILNCLIENAKTEC